MITPSISLERARHNNRDVLKIVFEKNDAVLLRLRRLQIAGLRWSQTMKSWYAPCEEQLAGRIVSAFGTVQYEDGSLASHPSAKPEAPDPPKTRRAGLLPLASLPADKQEALKKFSDWMRSRRYSESTVGTYTEALKVFLAYFQERSLETIGNEDLVNFNNGYVLANKLSSSYQNQVVNAVKLFFRTLQMRAMDVELIHRPKRAKVLPNVLSREEVRAILHAHANLKHRAMLSLIYSCGLRCGELLSLKPEHVDSKRNLLILKRAKGKKDRIVPLSAKTISMLRDYYTVCKPRTYLFEGQEPGDPYDARTLQKVLKQALEKSGICKPVTLHWLRHSYATHLLENGTDLRYIQEILGHSSSRTTEIYTHVSTKSIQGIISPFDYL